MSLVQGDDECGSVWRRTSAHPDHELTGRFSVWRYAWVRTRRAKRRAQRAPVWRDVPYDQIETEPPRLLHPENARPSDRLPIVRESDGSLVQGETMTAERRP